MSDTEFVLASFQVPSSLELKHRVPSFSGLSRLRHAAQASELRRMNVEVAWRSK